MVRTAFIEERELTEGMLDWMSAARAPRLSGSADASTRPSSDMVSPGRSCEQGWKGRVLAACRKRKFQNLRITVGAQMRTASTTAPKVAGAFAAN